MSTIVIQTTDKEFNHYLSKAYADGYSRAIKDIEEHSSIDNDLINEEEALALLSCGKSKLSNLRSAKSIVFYTHTRPFHYSKKSIEAYIQK